MLIHTSGDCGGWPCECDDPFKDTSSFYCRRVLITSSLHWSACLLSGILHCIITVPPPVSEVTVEVASEVTVEI